MIRNRLTRPRFSGWPWLLLAVVCALFASSAHAVITVDSVSTAVDNNPTSLTVSHTTAGADRLMIVGVSLNNDDFETVTSVTYNGLALTFVGQVSQNDDARVELWSMLAPPTVTANVVVTFNEQVQRGAGDHGHRQGVTDTIRGVPLGIADPNGYLVPFL